MAELPPVTTLADTNVSPTGTPTVGGYQLLGDGTESVALTNQTNAVDNGLFSVPVGGGPWERRPDFNSQADAEPFTGFRVLYGTHTGEKWYLTNTEAPVVGTDSITLELLDRGGPTQAGTGLALSGSTLGFADMGVAPGVYENPTITLGDNQLITDVVANTVSTGYIEGLGLRYVSATEVALDVGAAFIPGVNRVIRVDSPITATRLSGNNALYYAYLYETNGVGQLQLSTTEPDTPYFGSARTMDADDTMRYLGMLRNNAGGDILPFEDEVLGSTVFRTWNAFGTDTEVVTNHNGASLTSQDIGPDGPSAAKRLVSPATRTALMVAGVKHTTTPGSARVGLPPIGLNTPPMVVGSVGTMLHYDHVFVRLSEGQEIYYVSADSGVTLDLYVAGYFERR